MTYVPDPAANAFEDVLEDVQWLDPRSDERWAAGSLSVRRDGSGTVIQAQFADTIRGERENE